MTAGLTLRYGLIGLPLAFAALPVYVHVPRFYAENFGLELGLLGALLLALRLLDAGIDPVLGWLADRLPRVPMMLAGLLPFVAGFVALFNPPAQAGAGWLMLCLTLTYLGFSTASIAFQAWGADLGQTLDERTRLTAAREGFTLLGVVLAAALPTLLATQINEGLQRLSWLLVLIVIPIALVSLSLPRPYTPRDIHQTVPSGQLRRLLVDPAFRALLTVFVLNGIASALPATLFLFFVADILQQEAASGPLLALYFTAGAAGLPLWVKLAARRGRPQAWLAAMGLAIVSFTGASLIGPGDLGAFALICLMSGLALGADLALPAALAADLGERRGCAGQVFGLWNMAAKINLALAAGLALPLLGGLGYTPGGAAGLSALQASYALLPLAFKCLAAGLLWRWRHLLEK